MSVVECLQILLQVHKIVTTNNKEEKIRIRYQTPGVAGALLPRLETRVAPLELPGARARAIKEVFIAFTSLSKNCPSTRSKCIHFDFVDLIRLCKPILYAHRDFYWTYSNYKITYKIRSALLSVSSIIGVGPT